ncbi:hypothetical protein [Synechococcus sp. HJ21-Hayes]|uniref:hypothetical protein n=1 Tax=Synechococcus sp. HJ21-Hayes TaxID=2823736 RepID=UPI0020CDC8F3|nr:hypothetical protein [Synechococcus sp. HJ21-Hayes]
MQARINLEPAIHHDGGLSRHRSRERGRQGSSFVERGAGATAPQAAAMQLERALSYQAQILHPITRPHHINKTKFVAAAAREVAGLGHTALQLQGKGGSPFHHYSFRKLNAELKDITDSIGAVGAAATETHDLWSQAQHRGWGGGLKQRARLGACGEEQRSGLTHQTQASGGQEIESRYSITTADRVAEQQALGAITGEIAGHRPWRAEIERKASLG